MQYMGTLSMLVYKKKVKVSLLRKKREDDGAGGRPASNGRLSSSSLLRKQVRRRKGGVRPSRFRVQFFFGRPQLLHDFL